MTRWLGFSIAIAIGCGAPARHHAAAPAELGDTHVTAPTPSATATPKEVTMIAPGAGSDDAAMATTATTADDEVAHLRERQLGVIEEVGRMFVTTKLSCAAASDALHVIGTSASPRERYRGFEARVGAAIDAIVVSDVAKECAGDKAFGAAIAALVKERP